MQTNRQSLSRALLIIGILFIAFNLRPAITSVGPLIPSIRTDMGISNSVAGFITTLPLLSFAILSPIAPSISRRLGNERTIFIGLILLTVGISIRSYGNIEVLLIGTAFIGLGIAICNVLLPSVIKNRYPTKVGIVTSLYTTAMSIFAASASGISIPLANTLGLGWGVSLGVWAILSGAALLIWLPQLRTESSPVTLYNQNVTRKSSLLRSTLAWQVTLFMGLQSFLFYCTITWLPDIFHSQGINITTAGLLLAVMQFAGLPATFFTPILAEKLENQRSIVFFVGLLYIVGLLGLFLSKTVLAATITVLIIGFAQGACISLSLALLNLRAKTASEAASLSGMAQSVGYLLAAVGPIMIGSLFDKTATWMLPIITFVVVACFMMTAGLGAGRNEYVNTEKSPY